MLDREKVGRAIAEQRRLKGMTQKHLADIRNVSCHEADIIGLN